MAMRWKRIASAPKDYGKSVLLYDEHGITLAWWGGNGWCNSEQIYIKATHWMPLPPPPTK